MNIFFCENLNHTDAVLNEEESKHAVQVLRLHAGDAIHVIDGYGKFCSAEIISADAKSCGLKLTDCKNEFQKRNYYLHIAIAPTKQMERYEGFIEKAIELGVDEITPLICHNSVRVNIRKDRLEKIILSAVKQSVQAYIPELNDLAAFGDFIKIKHDAVRLIAHCNGTDKKQMQGLISKKQSVIILIGPEGDFTDEEISSAIQSDFIPVSLGETRLRTETAGIYASSVMRMING